MKKSKITFSIAAFLVAAIVVVSSCKKSTTTTTTPDSDVSGANDNSTAETHANDIIAITAQASESPNGSLSTFRVNDPNSILSTATVYQYPNKGIDTVVFSGTAGADGRVRSGMIILNYNNSTNGATFYRMAGYNCIITSYNYVVDGNQVIINNANVTNTGFIQTGTYAGDLSWTMNLNLKIIKANNGGTITWSCSRAKYLLNTSTYTYTGGSYQPAYTNQSTPINWTIAVIGVVDITNSSGTDAAGENFIGSITNMLIRNFNCNISGRHPFVQGTINFTPGTKAVRTIDFGTISSCDLAATVTISGTSYAITLP